MQSPKGWKLLPIIGLLIILSVAMWKTKFLTRTKMSWVTRLFILNNRYKALWPYMKAQAKLETNNFTSNAYLNEHNMFGMGNAEKRSNQPGKSSTQRYDGGRLIRSYFWDVGSVKDLLNYFEYVNFPTSVTGTSQYAAELKKRAYFQSDELAYKNGLDRWII